MADYLLIVYGISPTRGSWLGVAVSVVTCACTASGVTRAVNELNLTAG